VLRTNCDGEFTSVEFATYCADQGVERRNNRQHGTKHAKGKEVADSFPGRGDEHGGVHRQPLAHEGAEGQDGVRSVVRVATDVSFLRTFECIGHVKNTTLFISKLEDRSTPMVLLGYEEGSKAYKMYDPCA
jgi:hypothetical protein